MGNGYHIIMIKARIVSSQSNENNDKENNCWRSFCIKINYNQFRILLGFWENRFCQICSSTWRVIYDFIVLLIVNPFVWILSIKALSSCCVHTSDCSQDFSGQLSVHPPPNALIVPPGGIQGAIYWIIFCFLIYSFGFEHNIPASLCLTAETSKFLSTFSKFGFYKVYLLPFCENSAFPYAWRWS